MRSPVALVNLRACVWHLSQSIPWNERDQQRSSMAGDYGVWLGELKWLACLISFHRSKPCSTACWSMVGSRRAGSVARILM